MNRNDDIEHDSAPDGEPGYALRHDLERALTGMRELLGRIERLEARMEWTTREIAKMSSIANRALQNSDHEVKQL